MRLNHNNAPMVFNRNKNMKKIAIKVSPLFKRSLNEMTEHTVPKSDKEQRKRYNKNFMITFVYV